MYKWGSVHSPDIQLPDTTVARKYQIIGIIYKFVSNIIRNFNK